MEENKTAATQETAGTQPKKQKNKANVFILAISALLLLGIVWSTARAVRDRYESELDTTYETLANALFAVRNLISFEDSLQSSYESFDLREAVLFTDVAKVYFDYNGVTESALSDYAYRMGDCSIFFFPNAGGELASDNADEFLLDESQLRTLKTVGVLEAEGHDYTAIRLDGGWLCIQWDDTQELYNVDFDRILETCPVDLCVIESTTGSVLANSGKTSYDFQDESLVTSDGTRTSHATDGIQAGFYGGSKSDTVYFERVEMLNRYSVVAYTPLHDIRTSAMRTIAPEFCLMALIFAFIWFCAMRLRKQGADIQDQEQCQQFTKDYYINLPVARHAAILLIIGVALTLAISVHLPLLTNYVHHNDKMENNLNSFVSEMQLSDEEWEKITDIFCELVTDRAVMIAEMKEMMGEDFGEDDLAELARSLDFVGAVVYDEHGTAVMSTDGYIGYTLSQNPEDDEFVLWTLLNNADVSLMHEKADGSGYFTAVRRLDAPGIICAMLTNSALSAMREQTDVNAALLRVNTDTYAKMFVSAAEPETMLWATASSEKVRSIPNNLPETALLARYFGTQRVAGYDYYLNTMSDDEHIIISAERSETLTKPVTGILVRIIPACLILALAILLMSCVYREIDDWLKDDYSGILTRVFSTERGAVKKEDAELDEALKKMIAGLFGLVFAALIAMYVIDALFSQNPVSAYLFSNQWDHKIGIFSLTTILLSVAFAVIGVTLLKKLLELLSGRMDSRAKTVSNLIASIVQFVVTLVVAIYALYQVGVNTSVILTSAGVISLIIGYGSQSIVSDLVSGLFLITEDQVRIGDCIILGDFRGIVTHIGLRTTTVELYNNLKVINNSQMVGFINLSRYTSGAHWQLSFSVDQDMDEVMNLIMSNGERFQKACKDRIMEGPIFIGMEKGYSDYIGSHYTLRFMFVCDGMYWHSVRKRSYECAYRILMEKGIKPTAGELLITVQ
ncbi:MAG: mechanosensitive ion channel [Oscillospiraceae bacterium]|nr:mechanosensitive ion channel [Oscillospiraceae bacterium]